METERVVVTTAAATEEDHRYVMYVRGDTLVIMGPSMPKNIHFHDMSVEPTTDLSVVVDESDGR